MNTKLQTYDIIGDIHGYADILHALLKKLGYVEKDGVYSHPERKVIFVGDFIDRGPKIRETLEIVRAMVKAGTAFAVMGNHEYNALAFHTPGGNDGFLRPHTEKKIAQHQATLDQIVTPDPTYWQDCLAWFKTLPLFLDLGALRIVHACWDDEQIAFLGDNKCLTEDLFHASAIKGTPEFRAIETLLKGKEIKLPKPHTFTDKEGIVRDEMRVKWWLSGEGQTYHSLCLPECETVPKIAVPPTKSLERGYAETEPPVFVGHYWLPPATPALMAPNVACVDYSVAKEGGILVAYRWDGEALLDPTKFVRVPRERPSHDSVDEVTKVTPQDRDALRAIEHELQIPNITPEWREDLRDAHEAIAGPYVTANILDGPDDHDDAEKQLNTTQPSGEQLMKEPKPTIKPTTKTPTSGARSPVTFTEEEWKEAMKRTEAEEDAKRIKLKVPTMFLGD